MLQSAPFSHNCSFRRGSRPGVCRAPETPPARGPWRRVMTKRARLDADPVCGMEVDPSRAGAKIEHQGTIYHFCCDGCLNLFRADPATYLAPRVTTPAPGHTTGPRVRYTCPMHPQIVRDRPGACPICGMGLEPVTPTLQEDDNAELGDMTRRFLVGCVLTAPLLLIAMSGMVPALEAARAAPARLMAWVELLLATPVVLYCGRPFFERGWASIVNRSLNMFTLIAMGTGVSYAYSLVATLVPGLFPPALRTHGGQAGVYFETAAAITVLVLFGQVIELRARSRTGGAIRALLALAPRVARRLADAGW